VTNLDDPEDLDASTIIAVLNRHGVHYVVIGALAAQLQARQFLAPGTSTSLRPTMMRTWSVYRRRCTNSMPESGLRMSRKACLSTTTAVAVSGSGVESDHTFR